MPPHRPSTGNELEGNAWTFTSIDAARAAYQAALTQPGFLTGMQDLSLNTGFFAGHAVLILLWGSNVHPELVRGVERLATIAGGTELARELKEELLRQARLRWRAQRSKRPLGGTLLRHYPQGKRWTDLRE